MRRCYANLCQSSTGDSILVFLVYHEIQEKRRSSWRLSPHTPPDCTLSAKMRRVHTLRALVPRGLARYVDACTYSSHVLMRIWRRIPLLSIPRQIRAHIEFYAPSPAVRTYSTVNL